MALYQYLKLRADTREIRLVTVLSGSFNDPVRVRILHVPLPEPQRHPSTRMTRDELQSTVPQGWNVRQTIEGCYAFTRGSATNPPYETSWVHPVPDFNASFYEGYLDKPDPDFQPKYETLSYVWGPTGNSEKLFVLQTNPMSRKVETKILDIRQNLASALKHLRYADTSRTIWIDAICLYSY